MLKNEIHILHIKDSLHNTLKSNVETTVLKMMRKIRIREPLSVLEAPTFVSVCSMMPPPLDSDKVQGERSWSIPEFPWGYSTPLMDNRPAATPMINRGSLN